MKINPKIYHAALILYLLAIFILSSIPGEEFPKVDFEFSDKIVHIVIYAILFILFFYSLNNQSKYAKLQKFALEFSLLFTALYGLTDEIHQYFVPKRSCEFGDWIADVLGGLLVFISFKIYYSKKKSMAAALLLLTMLGCSSSNDSADQNKNVKITVSQQEAWIDLMPVVDPDKINFGFQIGINIETSDSNANYRAGDLKIYLNNDSLVNKKFNSEIAPGEKGSKLLSIFQLNEERYLDKDKALPEEAQFIVSIFKDNKKIKTVKTSKLTINKVY